MTIQFFKKNTEKYITFSVPIEKEVTRLDKNRENIKNYILKTNGLQFIASARLMTRSLSNLFSNLCFPEYTNAKDE